MPRLTQAATYQIPAITDLEVGLMTKEEMLKFLNPGDRHHRAGLFDNAAHNPEIPVLGSTRTRDGSFSLLGKRGRSGKYLIRNDARQSIIAVVIGDKAYYTPFTRPSQIPVLFWEGRDRIELSLSSFKKVKYLDDYIPKVWDPAKINRREYPYIVQRLLLGGRYFQIRSEHKPVPGYGDSLMVLDDMGNIAAVALNEWGATLISVNPKYRGLGIGRVLTRYWFKYNPNFKSGGFTPGGEKNTIRYWAERVREFLSKGWYSELIRKGKLSKKRVDQILSGLPEKRYVREEPKVGGVDRKASSTPLVYSDGTTFVIYDSDFLSDLDPDHIKAYGFMRNSSTAPAPYYYRIDYVPKAKKLANAVALQMAKDNGDLLYVGDTYSDVVEFDPKTVREVDTDIVTLKRDVLPLKKLSRLESALRKKVDKYGEILQTLIEEAEAKW